MKKKIVISASRRTDIPAYYSDWFKACIEKEITFYPNPYNPKSIVSTDLSPNAVKVFMFWTRNAIPIFKHLDYIDMKYNKKHYMHYTINGLPEKIEIRNPKIDIAINTVKKLANRYKKINYVQWRFDPIVISSISDQQYHIDKFGYIADKLKGYVERCYFSFVDYYEKTKRNFRQIEKKENIKFIKIPLESQLQLTKEIKSIADLNNIKLYACAEDDVYKNIKGIEKAHCVDMDIINEICKNENYDNYNNSPSRIGCGCIESKDIGYYDSCPHGCIYCYANMNPENAIINARNYLQNGFPYDNYINKNENNQYKLF